MRKPAQINPWLSTEEVIVWVREELTKESYRRRLAICQLMHRHGWRKICVKKISHF